MTPTNRREIADGRQCSVVELMMNPVEPVRRGVQELPVRRDYDAPDAEPSG